MTWEEREALIKEAALRLKWALETDREPPLLPWRRREWLETRGRAIEAYLVDVHAAYFAVATQYGAPSEEESKRIFAEAFNRALNEVPHPEVAARAEELKAHLEDFWGAQYWRARAEKGLAAPLPAETPIERMDETWLRWKDERLRIAERWRQKLQAEAAAVNQDTAVQTDSPRMHAEAPRGMEGRMDYQEPGMSEATPTSESETSKEVRRRLALLEEYKKATGATENQIENDPRHTCRHPEFLRWKRGELPAQSKMARSLEKFLRSKQPPTTRPSGKERQVGGQ
jgi:hypothetical protein